MARICKVKLVRSMIVAGLGPCEKGQIITVDADTRDAIEESLGGFEVDANGVPIAKPGSTVSRIIDADRADPQPPKAASPPHPKGR